LDIELALVADKPVVNISLDNLAALKAAYAGAPASSALQEHEPVQEVKDESLLRRDCVAAGACCMTSLSTADAARCLIVTLTGTQGGPQSFRDVGTHGYCFFQVVNA
jgi:hypothetical protein